MGFEWQSPVREKEDTKAARTRQIDELIETLISFADVENSKPALLPDVVQVALAARFDPEAKPSWRWRTTL
jgi:hypothetical protein